jgi:acetoin utilization protein AcuC
LIPCTAFFRNTKIKEHNAKTTYLIHSDSYANWIFDPLHPTQGRRFIKATELFTELAKKNQLDFQTLEPRLATRDELSRVHSSEYISEVLDSYRCGQWSGDRPDLAELATYFVGGTLIALDLLLKNEAQTAIHFPGAKHHAQFDYSSGFCVFADFALAADIASNDFKKKVAILDIDAHHGDGTENLTLDNPNVLTFSVHENGIFPGTGLEDVSEKQAFNHALSSQSGDAELIQAVKRFIEINRDFNPELIFIACGADGHLEDPLSSLRYSVEGFDQVAQILRAEYPKMPILIGGAGGYLPDSRTPEVWANFAIENANA